MVRFERRGSLGLAALARPERINALNLEMLEALEARIDEWAEDPEVVCVFVCGDGDRGFSAGGDVRAIVEALHAEGPAYGKAAFAAEYRIDHKLHTYPKPVVTFGHGAVMGAGLGLFVAGSTRLITPDAQLAMPEVTIGLFPDCGAAHFLSRMPDGVGHFAAWTGLRFAAADALTVDLVDRVVAKDSREALVNLLADLPPGAGPDEAAELCEPFSIGHDFGELETRRAAIAEVTTSEDPYRSLSGLSASEDPWLAAAGSNFLRASPTSLRIAEEALRRGSRMSLAECFQQDLVMAEQCMRHVDFAEGVRALLIDRDHAPKWNPPTIGDVTETLVAAHFEALRGAQDSHN